jgi:hypothetical protein
MMHQKSEEAAAFRFMNSAQLAAEMDLSVSAIRALQSWGAPFIAKKSHPRLLVEWMARHPEKLSKVE